AAAALALDLEALPPATYMLALAPQTDADVVGTLVPWVVMFAVLGWAAFPMMYALFPSLPLRGFAVGRGLAWLLLSVAAWWLTARGATFFWTHAGIWLLALAFLGAGGYTAYRHRGPLWAYVREHWRGLLANEVLFFAVLAFGL